MGYIAFVLDEPSRAKLLEVFPATHSDVVCHHVTLDFGVSERSLSAIADTMSTAVVGVFGYAVNDKVQALLVAVDSNNTRKDGGVFHITHSVNRANGGKPVHSNALVSDEANWVYIKCPAIPVTGTVQYFN